jgi:hypothetical protein
MADEIREALVIFAPSATAAVDTISAEARVTQIASERVLVVRGDSSSLDRVARLPQVARVLTGPASPEDLAGLDEKESLFVKAWSLAQYPKERGKTEGLPWDAPGFRPPDPPKKNS